MKLSLIILGILLACPCPLSAQDLTKIDRRLVKEPAYQTKQVKYCLLVFGPEAAHRVWLVQDGETLYVDRNGNGDLTEPGEVLNRTHGSFNLGAVNAADGTTTHGNLSVRTIGDAVRLHHHVPNGCTQFAGYDPKDKLIFANRAQDAPIVHFGGPLTMRMYQRMPQFVAGKDCDFNIQIGTPGVGAGSFAAMSCCSLPPGVKPLALVEFPHRDPTKAPIRVEYILDGD